MRVGNRLYVSYWHEGFVILDISDMSKPQLVSHYNTSPAFPHPTHTCLVMPKPLKGRNIMVVADEDVAKLWPAPPSFSWTYDITQERLPVPISTFQVPRLDPDGAPQPAMTGQLRAVTNWVGPVGTGAQLANALSTALFGGSVDVPVYVTRDLGSSTYATISLTATSVTARTGNRV